MEDKNLDFTMTLYEITEKYPELIKLFQEIGLKGAGNPVTRKTLGKRVTVVEGIKLNHLSLNEVVERVAKEGFMVDNLESLRDILNP